jgi:nucleoside-diphosphate-sugar epimerase
MDLARSTVAVTGATGFVGRYLVRVLLERGAHVVAVVRNPDKVPSLRRDGIELRKADLEDSDALTRAFRGADAVFANAAIVSLNGLDKAGMIRTNIEGTANVLRAMASAGVGRCVMTSSASVYRRRFVQFYREDDPLRDADDFVPRPMYYAVSKACAEREAWRLAAELGIALTTSRPHSIHGAFDAGSFTWFFKKLLAPPVTIYPTHVRFPSVYAGDLADAMCRMLEHEVAQGRAYNVANEPGKHTYWDLLRAYRDAGGQTPSVVVPFPFPISYRYDIRRAETDLGWRNRPLVDGFREMLELERVEGM